MKVFFDKKIDGLQRLNLFYSGGLYEYEKESIYRTLFRIIWSLLVKNRRL